MKLRVLVITQQDRFFIPKNVKKLSEVCEIFGIAKVNSKNSLENKITDFIKWFGIAQVTKLAFMTFLQILKSVLDNLSGYRLFGGVCSIKDIAKLLKVPYYETDNVNSKEFIKLIERVSPDLIVSYSAPQVFKPQILSIPKYGAINVHGSYLPDYRGVLPSFWQLYNGEKYAGATVHYMNKKIDEGDIILQDKVYIGDCKTMFEVIKRTKELGGKLVVETVRQISSGTVKVKQNDPSKGSYFTWPTLKDAKLFKLKGLRLI